MDKLRQWIAVTVVLVIAIAAAGWFLLISPKKQEAQDIRTQAAAQVAANQGLRLELATLKAQAKALPQQQAKLAAVAAKIPDNPALPSLIRALTAAAADAGVELLSLSPTKPAAVAAAPAAGVVAPPAAGAPAAAAPAGPSAGTLQSIGVSLSVAGGYFQVEQFLDRLESLSRAMKVGQIALAPGSNPFKPDAADGATRTLSANISGTVYMASGRVSSTPAVTAPAAAPGK